MNSNHPIRHILAVESGTWKKNFFLDKNTYSIGRNSTNSFIINHRVISRNHASLIKVTYFSQKDSHQSESIFWLVDGDLKGNRSTNGIYVNGKQCFSHLLKPGDIVFFGGIEVKAKYDIVNLETKTFFSFNSQEQISIFNEEMSEFESTDLSLPVIENKDLEKFELISEGILIIDLDTQQVLMANSTYSNIVDYPFSDIISLKVEDLFVIHKDVISHDFNVIKNYHISSIRESIHRKKDNSLVSVLVKYTPIIYNKKRCLFVSVQDINELKKIEDIIRFQTNHDPLTNLPNKRLFMEQLSLSLGHNHIKQEELAIIKLRLNYWREISSFLNIDPENKFLHNLIKQIKNTLSAGDTIAKWSDDEYIIMIEEAKNHDKIDRVIKNILANINKVWTIEDKCFLITLNFGISIHPQDGKNIQELLDNASKALRLSYIKSINSYQYYNSELIEPQKSLENLVFQAIKAKSLSVKYDPIVNTQNQEFFNLNSRISLKDNEEEALTDISILTTASSMGLTPNLIHWWLESINQDIKLWEETGIIIPKISVKILLSSLGDSEFVKYLVEIIKEKNIINLELDIICDRSIFDLKLIEENLVKLNEIGVSFALFDFDVTKFSDLDNNKVKFSTLKISDSLTSNLEDNSPKRPLIYSIISLANALNVKVIAEGISTETQRDILVNLGCEEMQGILFTPSLSAEKIITFCPSLPFEVIS
ncbi:EAL domain-containing protein [Geminocystis sp. NIES-3709]|uniref:EAL domain-containing protein n=1 Tax=Geminocystis sp. NIES-3709 TaxID=1617448 RepID=UPI0005FCD763|nr:EAL domain-containing protein [Geminocystis sp. NIES-3709]BAQ66392.1 diguanylate cyclase/phosphodiesterase with PAS/PAC sensor [Geminocystis sp. NIES-3709]